MFIDTIVKINSINGVDNIGKINNISDNQTAVNEGSSIFKDVFTNAVGDYLDLEKQVSNDVYNLATGQSDDLHNIMINAEKSEMALNLFIQLRNKAMDSYKELIGMSI